MTAGAGDVAETIPAGALGAPIEGGNLAGETLAAHLGDRRTVIAFLRHFG